MVNKLKLCRNCLHYIKCTDLRCLFCRGDPNSASAQYKILDYGGVGAFLKLGHILEGLMERRSSFPNSRPDG